MHGKPQSTGAADIKTCLLLFASEEHYITAVCSTFHKDNLRAHVL
jgi:hypothetical protein